jgi:hypothetical protein
MHQYFIKILSIIMQLKNIKNQKNLCLQVNNNLRVCLFFNFNKFHELNSPL